ENGETISKTAIKNRIKELVDQENKAKPLSDNELMKKLEEEGIFIKRRTTAKYREAIHLLPTHLRKRSSK
ncbi:MAG: RNA polymerase sigma-54 factor, partial [Candidatus Omnitrophica bacterium]|nr:RNA polymerase sigma-54 factor [Candidatus Omnitrophota bacterium]